MFVGLCSIELLIPTSRSLKAKRSVVQRIKGRLIRRFQASVAETGYQDLWQRSLLGVALVGSGPSRLQNVLEEIRRAVESEAEIEILRWSAEVHEYDPDAEWGFSGRETDDGDGGP
jgi:hypothetical protein